MSVQLLPGEEVPTRRTPKERERCPTHPDERDRLVEEQALLKDRLITACKKGKQASSTEELMQWQKKEREYVARLGANEVVRLQMERELQDMIPLRVRDADESRRPFSDPKDITFTGDVPKRTQWEKKMNPATSDKVRRLQGEIDELKRKLTRLNEDLVTHGRYIATVGRNGMVALGEEERSVHSKWRAEAGKLRDDLLREYALCSQMQSELGKETATEEKGGAGSPSSERVSPTCEEDVPVARERDVAYLRFGIRTETDKLNGLLRQRRDGKKDNSDERRRLSDAIWDKEAEIARLEEELWEAEQVETFRGDPVASLAMLYDVKHSREREMRRLPKGTTNRDVEEAKEEVKRTERFISAIEPTVTSLREGAAIRARVTVSEHEGDSGGEDLRVLARRFLESDREISKKRRERDRLVERIDARTKEMSFHGQGTTSLSGVERELRRRLRQEVADLRGELVHVDGELENMESHLCLLEGRTFSCMSERTVASEKVRELFVECVAREVDGMEKQRVFSTPGDVLRDMEKEREHMLEKAFEDVGRVCTLRAQSTNRKVQTDIEEIRARRRHNLAIWERCDALCWRMGERMQRPSDSSTT
ncbi:MAG: hypothetical protein OXF02_04990 [Simkaniaceae bacterium]|nr:hypothetical protein [Simkaniaceae bacterium]